MKVIVISTVRYVSYYGDTEDCTDFEIHDEGEPRLITCSEGDTEWLLDTLRSTGKELEITYEARK